jgi:hypothetical protein
MWAIEELALVAGDDQPNDDRDEQDGTDDDHRWTLYRIG